MATVLETTRRTQVSPLTAKNSPRKKNHVRSEESVNRFLVNNKNYEFINGRLVKKEISTAKVSGITTRLSAEIGFYLKKNKVGRVYGDNTIFQVGQNKRIPDVAFVRAEKIPATGEPYDIWNFAPDLAIEIISPSERHNNVEIKIGEYFAAGVRQVWKIIPELKTLTVYFSPTETRILTESDEITCEEILPGFRLNLSEIFID